MKSPMGKKTKKSSKSLGRGLDALLGTGAKILKETEKGNQSSSSKGDLHTQDKDHTSDKEFSYSQNQDIRYLPLSKLYPNPKQPRKRFNETLIEALVKSIAEQGVLQPILVRQHPDKINEFQIVAGERRFRAAQIAGLHTLPAVIKNLTDANTLEIGLIENIQREDLTVLEEAEAYQSLINQFKYTQEKLATSVGKSRSHIANLLRLLSLPDDVKSMLDDGLLSSGHARTLIGHSQASVLAEQIIKRGLNVRQAEQLAQNHKTPDRLAKRPLQDPNIASLENDLETRLGFKVTLKPKGDKGQLILNYRSLEQLDDVLALLASKKGT